MKKVIMYSTGHCPFCVRAEKLLRQRGGAEIEIDKIRIDEHPQERDTMIQRTNRRTVPQIFIGETHVGGFQDLDELDRDGKLLPLLNS
jgi:glutaredoxin 3